jgi:hypothetical protein
MIINSKIPHFASTAIKTNPIMSDNKSWFGALPIWDPILNPINQCPEQRIIL